MVSVRSGDVLVCPEGDGEEAVQQSAQRRRQEGGKETQQQTHQLAGVRVVELVEEGRRQARDAAQIHDAGDTQVQIAGFLRQDLTNGAEHDDGAELDGGLDQLDDLIVHLAEPSFPPRTITR